MVLCAPCLASKSNTAMDWFEKGQVYDSIGQITNATGAYKQATYMDPTFAEAWYNLGADYYAISDTFPGLAELADRCFNKYHEHDLRLADWERLPPMKVDGTIHNHNLWLELHAL